MKISNETKIGALTAVAITILILGYSYLRGNDVFSRANKYYAVYNSVAGLSVSKPVLVNGFQIGRVSNMQLQPDGRTMVEFKIEPDYNIPVNTVAKLESTDLLGSKAIVFIFGNSKEFAANKAFLSADIQGSLTESLQPVQMKAELLISRLDSSLASINKILNPAFQKNVDRSFLSIANSLQTLEGTTKKIDELVGSQSGHINNIMANAENVSGGLKTTVKNLNGLTSNFETFSDQLANANIKQTFESVNKAMADLQAITATMKSKDGSLGLLINDPQVYNNLKDATANLNNLMIDLKAHPGRYVSFSVFGGKKQ